MICPNHPLVCEAYIRFGSTGDPFRWYISQPAKCGPLTSHFSRLPSDVRINAPFLVPTSTRTPLIACSSLASLSWVPPHPALTSSTHQGRFCIPFLYEIDAFPVAPFRASLLTSLAKSKRHLYPAKMAGKEP